MNRATFYFSGKDFDGRLRGLRKSEICEMRMEIQKLQRFLFALCVIKEMALSSDSECDQGVAG